MKWPLSTSFLQAHLPDRRQRQGAIHVAVSPACLRPKKKYYYWHVRARRTTRVCGGGGAKPGVSPSARRSTHWTSQWTSMRTNPSVCCAGSRIPAAARAGEIPRLRQRREGVFRSATCRISRNWVRRRTYHRNFRRTSSRKTAAHGVGRAGRRCENCRPPTRRIFASWRSTIRTSAVGRRTMPLRPRPVIFSKRRDLRRRTKAEFKYQGRRQTVRWGDLRMARDQRRGDRLLFGISKNPKYSIKQGPPVVEDRRRQRECCRVRPTQPENVDVVVTAENRSRSPENWTRERSSGAMRK